MLGGMGSQIQGIGNFFTSMQNAKWEKAIAGRNAQIAENNARRIEAERAFVLAGMRKQASEVEKKQRRNLMELRSKFVTRRAIGIGTRDYANARLAQGENMVQLHRIAAENKIREADFDYRNRAYDARVKGQNQLIAGQRRAQAHRVKGIQSLQQGLDFSYLYGVQATMSQGGMGLRDLMPRSASGAPASAGDSGGFLDEVVYSDDFENMFSHEVTEPEKPLAIGPTHTRRAKRLGLSPQ
jgi:hypothetical protein